jgi:inner membrane protein involved in colicin E2 resistance
LRGSIGEVAFLFEFGELCSEGSDYTLHLGSLVLVTAALMLIARVCDWIELSVRKLID